MAVFPSVTRCLATTTSQAASGWRTTAAASPPAARVRQPAQWRATATRPDPKMQKPSNASRQGSFKGKPQAASQQHARTWLWHPTSSTVAKTWSMEIPAASLVLRASPLWARLPSFSVRPVAQSWARSPCAFPSSAPTPSRRPASTPRTATAPLPARPATSPARLGWSPTLHS